MKRPVLTLSLAYGLIKVLTSKPSRVVSLNNPFIYDFIIIRMYSVAVAVGLLKVDICVSNGSQATCFQLPESEMITVRCF